MSIELRQKLQNRKAELDVERQSYISHWMELTKFLSPRTGRYLNDDRTSRGAKKNDEIINSAATTALRTLKSGMHAGMTSQSRPWFRLITDDPGLMKNREVKEWLYIVEESLRVAFARSNFYNVMPMVYGSGGGHGTSTMSILPDDESIIRCYTFPIGSYYLGLDERMRVDTIYREFPMTARQAVMRFGLNNCSQTIKNMWDRSSYDKTVNVVHACEPDPDAILEMSSGKKFRQNGRGDWIGLKPFRSIYYEEGAGDGSFLEEDGFSEFPFMCPRWDVEGEDVYGFCPGMDALGLIKGLQFAEKTKYKIMDQIARPSMLADATLQNTRTSLLAGDVTYVNGLAQQQYPAFRPTHVPDARAIPEIRNDINEIKAEISKIFHEDLMLMFATSDIGQITAREVEERHQEKLLVLGPTIERYGEELYDPAIDRTFNILWRQGAIPPPPQALQGAPLKVEYISIMAQAQKLVSTASMERVAGFVGNIATMFPEAKDKFNPDAAIDNYSEMHGIPPNVINSDSEVVKIRKERAKIQQQQQAMEMIPAAAQAATAAKTLSETNIGDATALSRLIGAG